MDQVDHGDHGDHDPPWWTRSVQDHRGPPYDIFLMLALRAAYEVILFLIQLLMVQLVGAIGRFWYKIPRVH